MRLELNTDLNPGYPSMEFALERMPVLSQRPMASRTLTLSAPINIVPPEQASVHLLTGPEIREKLQDALHSPQLFAYGSVGAVTLSTSIQLNPCDFPFAADVYWRTADREWFAGSISTVARDHHWLLSSDWRQDDFDAATVDLVLRPSPAAARRTADLTAIVGEEFIIVDVPVRNTVSR